MVAAVALLAKRSAKEAILSVAADHAASSDAGGYVFAGSSNGATEATDMRVSGIV